VLHCEEAVVGLMRRVGFAAGAQQKESKQSSAAQTLSETGRTQDTRAG